MTTPFETLRQRHVVLDPVLPEEGKVTDFDVMQGDLLAGEVWTEDDGATWVVRLVAAARDLEPLIRQVLGGAS